MDSNKTTKVSPDQTATPFSNALLSAGASELLNKLVEDLRSKLPPGERDFDKKDNASLIYNLFMGNYEFSYKQYKEVFDALCAYT